ncbi:alcohol dehydrogenase catalytic domain-containing protein [candidate division KSB1 bacterium]|nr:alcohol dehydrogenase catalytic domain-containing protein [candidate division KSB1 bacterium]
MDSSNKMQAAVLIKYNQVEWKTVPVPEIRSDQVLVRVGYAGICGSDQHIFSGDFHPRTRVPFIPGHEFAGTVAGVGERVKHFEVGDRVCIDPIIPCGQCAACELEHYPACTSLKLLGVDMDGGFGQFVAADEHMVYKLDDRISERDASLIEVYSIGFHACNRAGLKADDTVAIWGGGRIGHSIAQAARTRTANKIFIIDILEKRLEIARQYYHNVITINPDTQDPVKIIQEHTHNRGVDVAFEAVGHAHETRFAPHPVRACVQSIHGAGTVCVLGLADDPAPIVMKELIWREAKIVASRVSHGEFSEAITHLGKGDLVPDALVTTVMPASDAQKAFNMLQENPDDYLKIVLDLNS